VINRRRCRRDSLVAVVVVVVVVRLRRHRIPNSDGAVFGTTARVWIKV
jgi:hypothetical protein